MAKPILKWAGGKGKILPFIYENFPEKYNNYVEPFVGGGAVFLDLMKENAVINDINSELINLYTKIRDDYKKVISEIEKLRIKYNKNPKDFFYKLRDEMSDSSDEFFLAARTLFLNKTCFNGLYRLNSKGNFNVPWNQKNPAPKIYDEDNLRVVSKYLEKIKILNLNYYEILNHIEVNDLVYIDPPYDKLTNSTFANYNGSEFNRIDQLLLKDFCDELTKRKVKFIQSNHNTEFIRELYNEYKISIINVARNINSKASGRGKIEEVLIKNF